MAERTSKEVRPGERVQPDPLAKVLGGLSRRVSGVSVSKIDVLFGHRPQVLESILSARARGVATKVIAEALSREGEPVGATAIENWLKVQRRKASS